jgi:hypothetical protein
MRESDLDTVRDRRKEAYVYVHFLVDVQLSDFDSILERASKLGYEQEVAWLRNDQPELDDELGDLKAVKQAKDLSDRSLSLLLIDIELVLTARRSVGKHETRYRAVHGEGTPVQGRRHATSSFAETRGTARQRTRSSHDVVHATNHRPV